MTMAPTSDASFSMAQVPEANGEALLTALMSNTLPQAYGINTWNELRDILTAPEDSIERMRANNRFQSIFSEFNLSKRIYKTIEPYPFNDNLKLEIYFASIAPNVLPTYIKYEANEATKTELVEMKEAADLTLLRTLRKGWPGAERDIFKTIVTSHNATTQNNNQ